MLKEKSFKVLNKKVKKNIDSVVSNVGNLTDEKNVRSQKDKIEYMKQRIIEGERIVKDSKKGPYPRALMIVHRVDCHGLAINSE